MISRLLRRPFLVVALLLAVVGLSGAGYAVTGGDRGGSADSGTALAAAEVSSEDDKQRYKAAKLAADREYAAIVEADRVAAEKAAAEKAAADKAAAEKAAAEKAAAEKAAAEKAAAEKAAAEKAAAEKAAQAKRAAQAEQAREQAAARASRDAARDPKGIARAMLGQHGWGSDQFTCLDRLWTKESGWKHTADNPTSDAYGIPQALPGSKMASAGADWATNPATQIRWGLQYIEDVYGAPCAAWAHSQATNWY